MSWPTRPSPKFPLAKSETEFLCHSCKVWKKAWNFPPIGLTPPSNTAFGLLEEAARGKRWACTACFLQAARDHGILLDGESPGYTVPINIKRGL